MPLFKRGSEPGGVSLAQLTTMQVGGRAREFHSPRTLEELQALLARLAREGREPFILGKGANTIFPDGEYPRPVVWTRRLRALEAAGRTLRAEAGVPLSFLISAAIRRGLGGLEGFVGIPATVGGAVLMNAGGGGWCFGERVTRLGLVPLAGGDLVELNGCDVVWGYRTANLSGYCVAWAEVKLAPDSGARLRRAARTFFEMKFRTQPLSEPSAGCIFKNPGAESAGRVIEALGLKGLKHGEAQVSERHGNFIVNPRGLATSRDVVSLVREVRERVQAARGICMETEVILA